MSTDKNNESKSDKINYEEVGLMCGVEIHQQLNTDKLFSKTPSNIRDDEFDYKINRKLRAVIGETGEVDIAAKREQKKNLKFEYEGYLDESISLVELDEEPPQEMNNDALNTVLEASKLMECKYVDEVQVMRKTVVNGSNTGGFQRTSLVAYNGVIKTDEGDVRVDSVCLEEDSCKDVEKGSDLITYNLSRLGIPLIEIATAPDIKTPTMCKQTCERIGMIVRSTGKAKRGLGTIRQDVNISIKGGERIEIKGAQDLKTIPLWIENEIIRQQNLIDIKTIIPQEDIKSEITDVTEIFKDSESKVLRKSLDNKGVVYAIKLPGFLGLTGREVQPGRRVGSELSDYAKIYGRVGGLFHTDELPKYGITQEDVDKVKAKLGCEDSKKDAFILVADQKSKCIKALEAVIRRANMFKEGVIKEVRKPNPDGTTSYMRPIPGRHRMYPETDCTPILVDKENIKTNELLDEKAIRLEKEYKLSKDVAIKIAKDHNDFEKNIKNYKVVKASFISEILIGCEKQIKKQFGKEISIDEEKIWKVLEYLEKGDIVKDSVLEILSKNKDVESIIDNYKLMNEEDLLSKVKEILEANKDKNPKAMIGIVMGQLKGKANPQSIIKLVNQLQA